MKYTLEDIGTSALFHHKPLRTPVNFNLLKRKSPKFNKQKLKNMMKSKSSFNT